MLCAKYSPNTISVATRVVCCLLAPALDIKSSRFTHCPLGTIIILFPVAFAVLLGNSYLNTVP